MPGYDGPRKDGPLALGAEQPSALALPTALFLGLAFVVELLASRQRKLDLGAPLLVEIELERHERHAFALDRSHQLVDLATVKQEFAHPLGRMIEAAALQIFRDVGVDQPDFVAASVRIG